VLGLFWARGLPVIHVLRVHRKDGSDIEIFRKIPLGRGVRSQGTFGPPNRRLSLAEEYTIEKTRMSAFMGTDLDLLLRSLGVTSLFVTGIQTPNCIRTTVFDAAAYNYGVFLVGDATAAQTADVHAANIRDMEKIGTRIIGTSEVSRSLDALVPDDRD